MQHCSCTTPLWRRHEPRATPLCLVAMASASDAANACDSTLPVRLAVSNLKYKPIALSIKPGSSMQKPPCYGSTSNSFVSRKRAAALAPISVIAIICGLIATVLLVSLHSTPVSYEDSIELVGIQYGKLSAVESRRDEDAINNILKGKIGAAAQGVPSSVIAAAQDAARAVKEQQMRVKHEADANLKKQAAIVNGNAQNLFEQAVKDQHAEDAAEESQMQIAMQSEHAQGFSVSKWDSVQK
jgi:hypothetical protein